MQDRKSENGDNLAMNNRACHPGGHYKDYYSDAISVNQVTATDLKIRHP